MDRTRCLVPRLTVTIGLIATSALPAGAGQLFSVQTPSGNGTGTCFDPYPGCSLAGLLGADTAINAGGRFTDFFEFGQTGAIPPGVNIFAHIRVGQTAETVTMVYSIDGLQGGVAWSQEFSALLHVGDTGELRTYMGSTLGAQTTLLATQDLVLDGHGTLSGAFDFGPDPYTLTQVLTLNLQPGPGLPDYGRLLEDGSGFYYGTLTVTPSPEPTDFLLFSAGLLLLGSKQIHALAKRPKSA